MAASDIDVVRDQFEAVNERDFAKAMDAYAEDVVLVVDLDFVDPGTYEGREAVGRWFGGWFSTFEPGYSFKFEEIRLIGEWVYLDASHGGRGKSSGIEVTGRMGYLYRVRDGKVNRVELFRTPADALAAAGAPSTEG